ncbi:SDR family NAD(P)-dependent oxidoreductase, partial [Verrucomicrobiales bacterium]|nr:SDR family NAD(P)-dependent oxidoreductase [Verrucomicrobiales bacterium]
MSSPDDFRLDGKRALVTGAGRGIGKGCAIELAEAGAELILNDHPGSEELAETAAQIRDLGSSCHAIEADVFSRDGIDNLVAQAVELAGGIDILVSNPAYGQRGGFLDFPA